MGKYLKVKLYGTKFNIVAQLTSLKDDTLGESEMYLQVSDFDEGITKIQNHNKRPKQTIVKPNEMKQIVWNWDRAPRKVKDEILELYENNQYMKIMQIHNKYKLSSEHYCCSSYIPKIKSNIEEYLKNIKI